jgi:hypothetical protein
MSRKPKEYWQDRAVQAEEAIVRLSRILYDNFPTMRADLEWHKNEWNRVIAEVEAAYPDEPAQDQTTPKTQ